MPTNMPTPTVTDCGIQFADMPPTNIFYYHVHWLACVNAISGFPDGLFHPSTSATRGQFAKIIVRAYNWPRVTPTSGSTFSDVPPSSFWFVYVETMASRNITHGYVGNECTLRGIASPCYLPNRNILRSELVRMVVKARNWTIDTTGGPHFSDVPPSYWAYIYIETAYRHGVISGSGNPPTFRPNDIIRRDELCKVVVLGITNPMAGP
jgi:S-layer homology domain